MIILMILIMLVIGHGFIYGSLKLGALASVSNSTSFVQHVDFFKCFIILSIPINDNKIIDNIVPASI